MHALIVNAGSSSLKWSVLARDGRLIASDSAPWASHTTLDRVGQIRATIETVPAFGCAGHRIVHGGAELDDAAIVDGGVRRLLLDAAPLAPEHMSVALVAIDTIAERFPERVQVAAFDTAFHRTLSPAASIYGLPFEWTERWGLRRYGFHGLSVAHAVERAGALIEPAPTRLIVCHLGSGCSVTGVEGGRSVDTTMGYSPLEGVLMSTRSGSVDPGLLLHLQTKCGVGPRELRDALANRSGLLGVSGISGDLREVVAAANDGAVRAKLAYELFILTIRRAVGAMAGVLGGVDGVVYTGGVGENSPEVRREVSQALAFAGLEISIHANEAATGDRVISAPTSTVHALVVEAREDLAILADIKRLGAFEENREPQ